MKVALISIIQETQSV